jgi:MarR family transcriptional regulator, lower aerobic nicotinate degradation pathway regulator
MTKAQDMAARNDDGTAGAAQENAGPPARRRYSVTSQVGFLLRKAQQRHVNIFTTHMLEDLTPMQFAVLAKLSETGPCSQNSLGRRTAMDVATIKGVVARLDERGLVHKLPSSEDRRKLLIDLTPEGRRTVDRVIPQAVEISAMTLAPLTRDEQAAFLRLLRRLS